MDQLKVSLFSRASDNSPKGAAVTWGELVEALSDFDTRDLKDGPAWSPATFDGLRAIANVTSLSCLVYDLDEETPTINHVPELHRWAHHLHSTHSGGWRLVFPLSREISPAEHVGLWESCAQAFGLAPDAACKDAARLFYLPSHPPGVEALSVTHVAPPLDPSAYGLTERPRSSPPKILVDKTEEAPKILDMPGIDLEAILRSVDAGGAGQKTNCRKILSGEFSPPQGQRDNAWAAALMALANYVPDGAHDSLLPLFQVSLDKMDLAGEPPQVWTSKVESLWRRAAEKVRTKRLHAAKTRDAIDRLAPLASELDLLLDKEGKCLSASVNVERILEGSEQFAGKIRLDTMRKKIVVAKDCFLHGEPTIDVAFTNWLQGSDYGIFLPRQTVADNLLAVAKRNEFSPVTDWLTSLSWDGTARIDTFFREYCGAIGNPEYVDKVSRKFFVSAAARGTRPGCKVDSMLVLQGPGGIGKTRLVQLLANGWSCSLKLDVHNKDSVQAATSNWLVELAELATLRRSDKESLKAFLTNTHDEVRLPYERTSESYPRSSVFIGTTNDDEFLDSDDMAANRRFWPITVAKINIEAIRPIVPQLWAEAMVVLNGGDEWWFAESEKEVFENETRIYRRESSDEAFAALIAEWYCKLKVRPHYSTSEDIARAVLSASALERYNDAQLLRRMSAALRILNVVPERVRQGTVRRRVWIWPDELRSATVVEAVSGKVIFEDSVKGQS